MSKPITLPKPASFAVSTMPTTPPAGPDSSASLPWKRSAAVRPPDDIMNMRRTGWLWLISPRVGEMPGRAEGGNVERPSSEESD